LRSWRMPRERQSAASCVARICACWWRTPNRRTHICSAPRRRF